MGGVSGGGLIGSGHTGITPDNAWILRQSLVNQVVIVVAAAVAIYVLVKLLKRIMNGRWVE